MIVSLLKSGNIDFEQIKMFALYGNWGSGKSTLMKYMQKELKGEFKTFYFDAWKYENDTDLSFSLLEFLIDTGHSRLEKECKNLLDIGKKVLIGSLKGINPILKNVTEELQKEKEKSFHRKVVEFEEEFELFESILFQETQNKYNIVFIDDLDRCEPEKVLDLLSEIKLFFTFGKKTIFFFGVDQKAVEAAIKTKYGTVIKSNEYLEKIFDLTFNMPTKIFVSRLTSQIFSNHFVRQMNNRLTLNELIGKLFISLEINNPRKIKKALNKYLLLLIANDNSKLLKDKGLIHKLTYNHSPLYTVYSIYLIILKLFSETEFENFGMSPYKTQKLFEIQSAKLTRDTLNVEVENLENFISTIDLSKSLNEIFSSCIESNNNIYAQDLLCLSIPLNLKDFHHINLTNEETFSKIKVENSSFSYRFCHFIFDELLPFYRPNDDDEIFLSVYDFKMLIKQLS